MSKQVTIGELIALLESRPADHRVVFDFGAFRPTGVGSYRGYYNQLAIGFDGAISYGDEDAHPKNTTVAELLTVLREAVGETYEGWKGGDFTMTERTPLWVANAGRCHGTAVIGIAADCEWRTVISTAYEN